VQAVRIDLALGLEERVDRRVGALELRGGIVQLLRQEEPAAVIRAEIHAVHHAGRQ
jgi:hypothetical protein